MPVPNLSRALKGWVTKTLIQRVTQEFQEDGSITEKVEEAQYSANFQPMNPESIKRLSEEYRGRKLWTVYIQSKVVYLEPNGIIVDYSGAKYRIINSSDWRTSGYTQYDVEKAYDN